MASGICPESDAPGSRRSVTRPDSQLTPAHEQGVASVTRQRRGRPPTAERRDSRAALSAARSGADIGRRRTQTATTTRICSCMLPVSCIKKKKQNAEAPEKKRGQKCQNPESPQTEGPVNGETSEETYVGLAQFSSPPLEGFTIGENKRQSDSQGCVIQHKGSEWRPESGVIIERTHRRKLFSCRKTGESDSRLSTLLFCLFVFFSPLFSH